MLKKVSDFIVDHRWIILALMTVLALTGGFAMQKVEINKDMTKYLPDDSSMKKGVDLMAEEFPEAEVENTIRVMFDDLTPEQKTDVQSQLESIPGVDSVTHQEDSEDYNRDNHTLYVLGTTSDFDSEEELAIEKALDEDFGDYTMVWHADRTGVTHIPTWIIVAAVSILMVILFVMCGSWIEPILFLVVIGAAILINMGTNLIMGSVSDVTASIAAILQLVLSMDYSIILINRYRQECELTPDRETAMKNALANAFSSVASSSLTTVVGLLMLVFMSFKIGMDLGIVLAKGVFISMVCVLTMLPGIILACDRLIVKTAKKSPHIPMGWAAAYSCRMNKAIGVFFLVFFVAVFLLQRQTGIAYTLKTEDPVAEVFPADNTIVMVYENQDEEKMMELEDELQEDENIKSLSGYGTTLGKPLTAAEFSEQLSETDTGTALDESLIDMLYYDYFDGEVQDMTAGDFLKFLSDTVLNNETFSSFISSDMKEQADLLKGFSDADTLTKAQTAQELGDFFGMDGENILDLLLFQKIQNGEKSSDTLTLQEFADFIINDVATDETYGSMFDQEMLSQIRQLSSFTDPEKVTSPLGAEELSALTGMDADSIRMLMVYYNAQSEDYEPEAMTLPELVSFLQTDVANNPAFSSYMDGNTKDMIQTLGYLADKEFWNTKHTAAEFAEITGMEEYEVDAVLSVAAIPDGQEQPMSLASFVSFLDEVLSEGGPYANQLDEEEMELFSAMKTLVETAASGELLDSARMADILSIDQETVSLLYFLYFSQDPAFQQELATATMTFPDFISIAGSVATGEEKEAFTQIEAFFKAAASGEELTPARLAAIIGVGEEDINSILDAYSMLTGETVTTMTVKDFIDLALSFVPDDPDMQQMKALVDLASSNTPLDAATLASVLGITPEEAGQIMGMALAAQKSVSLPEFTDFLVNTVLTDETYSAALPEEQKEGLVQLNQLASLAASGTPLDAATMAAAFGMDEGLISLAFRQCQGSSIENKTMSFMDLLNFMISDNTIKTYLEDDMESVIQIRDMMLAVENGTQFSYYTLAMYLERDPEMFKMLFTYHDSLVNPDSFQISPKEMVDFLTSQNENLGSMITEEQSAQIQLLAQIMNGALEGTSYSAGDLSSLLGIPEESLESLYLLHTRKAGDTSGWTISIRDFLNFLTDSVLTNEEMSSLIDADTASLLTGARSLVEAVISEETRTPQEMTELLSGMTEELDSNTMELLYLYASSENAGESEETLSMDTLMTYLTDEVCNDPRFEPFIDETTKEELTNAKAELDEGKAQLVSENYSRLIITSSYPDESEETTAFLDKLNQRSTELLSGEYHLVGNSAMNYEMQQTFNRELTMITLLTACAIFLIVAFTFRSLFIPLLLVLVVQAGVYATVSVVGFTGGSMYYLALLIVECILMGATIDYGILFTNYYREKRATLPIQEALAAAYEGSVHTILTSGLILILVTAIIGNFFEEPTISAIVGTISIGALCAVLLILFVLPGLLALFDRFVCKKSDKK